MDPNTLAWFLALALHASGAGCCNGRVEIKLPSIECKLQAAGTCTVPAYDLCKALGAANTENATSIECIAKPKS